MKSSLFCAVLMTQLCAANVFAQDCKPLQLIDTIRMTTLENDGRRTVPVTINSVPATLLLDTGGFISQLTIPGVEKIGLHVQKSGSVKLYDIAGNTSTQSAAADDFMIGRLKFSRTRLFIMPAVDRLRPFDGLLAANMMISYDVELDFAQNTMKYFLSDHCDGKVIYWPTSAVGFVPITMRDNAHIEVEVTLNDKTFEAIVDTGATDTVMEAQVAKNYFGVSGPAPGDTVYDSDPKNLTFLHTFSKLSFGDITVTNPRVVIYTDRTREKDRTQQTGNRALRDSDMLVRPRMLIGMNILQRLHIYMAFREKRFYVTPASAPPTP